MRRLLSHEEGKPLDELKRVADEQEHHEAMLAERARAEDDGFVTVVGLRPRDPVVTGLGE